MLIALIEPTIDQHLLVTSLVGLPSGQVVVRKFHPVDFLVILGLGAPNHGLVWLLIWVVSGHCLFKNALG